MTIDFQRQLEKTNNVDWPVDSDSTIVPYCGSTIVISFSSNCCSVYSQQLNLARMPKMKNAPTRLGYNSNKRESAEELDII